MVTTHSIRIQGRELQVKSTSTAEHVARVEALVNEKLAEAVSSLSTGDSQLAAILALMNLAESCLSAQQDLEEQRRNLKDRVATLLGRLDRQTD